MVPAGRRRATHTHQWCDPRPAGLLDRRMARYCTVKGCGATRVLRHSDGRTWMAGEARR